MRMVAAGLRAGSSGTRPDVKRPDSLAVARANGTCRQSGARRRRAPTVRTAARLWLCPACCRVSTSHGLSIERLATLTPRPRINVVLYHGVLAPRAKWRAAAVAYGRAEAPATADDPAPIAGPAAEPATTSTAIPGRAEQSIAAGPGAAADVSPATAPGRE